MGNGINLSDTIVKAHRRDIAAISKEGSVASYLMNIMFYLFKDLHKKFWDIEQLLFAVGRVPSACFMSLNASSIFQRFMAIIKFFLLFVKLKRVDKL